MRITKRKADKCVIHHNACDCRKYRMQEMEQALKIILTWAVCEKKGNTTSQGIVVLVPDHVINLCEEALGMKK